jgi:hypothetical protein
MLLRRWRSGGWARFALFALLSCSLAGPAVGKGRKKPKSAKSTKKQEPASAEAKGDPASRPSSRPAVRPAVPSAKGDELVFIGVGDMMLGTTFPDETGALLPPDDGAKILAEVAPYLAAADLAFGNLEGPLLEGGKSEKCTPKELKASKCFAFRSPIHYAKYFKDAGFDVMSLANNHAMDFGEEGMDSSAKLLTELGIAYSGKIGEIAHLTVKGKKVDLIAFAASATYLSPTFYDLERAKAVVAESAAKADIVIVSFHGGKEGAKHQHFSRSDAVNEAIYDFAHAVVDAGADLVVGHGPHVLRGMELYKDRLIAYSLGNFATYRKFNLEGPAGLSMMLEVRLAADGAFLGGQIHPARQDWPGGPRLDPSGEAIGVVKGLSEEDFGATAVLVGEDGTLSPPSATAAAP